METRCIVCKMEASVLKTIQGVTAAFCAPHSLGVVGEARSVEETILVCSYCDFELKN